MRINEILLESPQYENDAEISLSTDIRELTNFYKNFDIYVNAKGRAATETLARNLLASSYSADWLTKVV